MARKIEIHEEAVFDTDKERGSSATLCSFDLSRQCSVRCTALEIFKGAATTEITCLRGNFKIGFIDHKK